MKYHSIPFILFLIGGVLSCKTETEADLPWHGIERSVRYHPEGTDIVITNGALRFNRALYGTHSGFRIEAGDLPEFALYLPGMGGNFKLGMGRDSMSAWLIDAEDISSVYRAGSMLYQLKDPLLGDGILSLHLLARHEGDGLILKVTAINVEEGSSLYWAFGGASGKKFPRSGDIGADPESSFYLKPEYCKNNEFQLEDNSFSLHFGEGRRIEGLVPPESELRIADAFSQDTPQLLFNSHGSTEKVLTGKRGMLSGESLYFFLKVPGGPGKESGPKQISYEEIPVLFELAETARKEIAGRIVVRTPDPHINTLGPALGIAADAIWESPSYLHGAVAWRSRLAGWRGAYAADCLGWHDRAHEHFSSYAASQYREPSSAPAAPDPATNLSRQIEKAGHSLFSEGYISRRPGKINPPHHYDMNLVFIDQLLWHFNWTGDLDFARQMWPVIKRHFVWEKRCFDSDADGLYNAYCCIWASDALQYSGGGVSHSSAYNYRGNLLAGRLAQLIGEDPSPFLEEAEKIRSAVNEQLWLGNKGWYAEYKDHLGLQLIHPAPGLWTIYHALDAGLADPFQAYQSLRYVDHEIPHIPMHSSGLPDGKYYSLSTSNWMPYTWSINNVALSENLHTSLAYWQGGRKEEAFRLWKSQLLESMFSGSSPGNFQQLSFYDAFRGELYRDFADPVGMVARSLVGGLFGIVPDALEHLLLVRPGYPDNWDSAHIHTPDVSFTYRKEGSLDHYLIIQDFPKEMDLLLILDAKGSRIDHLKVNGREGTWQIKEETVGKPVIRIQAPHSDTIRISIAWSGQISDSPMDTYTFASGDVLHADFGPARILKFYDPQKVASEPIIKDHTFRCATRGLPGHRTLFVKLQQEDLVWWQPLDFELKEPLEFKHPGESQKDEWTFIAVNNSEKSRAGKLEVNGHIVDPEVRLKGRSSKKFTIPMAWLLPGSNHIKFYSGETVFSASLVDWSISARADLSWVQVDLEEAFNDRVDQIFKNTYLSPRAKSPTLQIPIQGIGDWCSYERLPEIDDSGLRKWAGDNNRIVLDQGIPLKTPGKQETKNIIYTSRWDRYPHEVKIPLSGKARHAYFLMTGSVHHMQSRMCNGQIKLTYTDGSADTLALNHPNTWWPIEQDYYTDEYAFRIDSPRPPRIYLKKGEQQRVSYQVLKKNGTNDIDGGAATLYDLPLDPSKELKELHFETFANDVVMGLMSLSLIRADGAY